jgi:hypothetical protein
MMQSDDFIAWRLYLTISFATFEFVNHVRRHPKLRYHKMYLQLIDLFRTCSSRKQRDFNIWPVLGMKDI